MERPSVRFSLTLTKRGRKSPLGRQGVRQTQDPGTARLWSGPLSLDITSLSCHPQELSELKDQIQDVEGKYMQGLKEMKVPVCSVAARH